jgi:serine-type D-Ala-D-Ala carboxypeptidase/endopeptidase (penicillin-binding protein 4)
MSIPMSIRNYLFLVIFFINAAGAQQPPPAPATLPPPVAQALAAVRIPESGVGLYVHEVGAAEPVAAHRAGEPFNPASVMKLVTTYAGLEMLGPAHHWSTDIFTDGVLKDDVLTGNVYLKGGGDPRFTIENFWTLLRALRAKGVRDIRGDLVLDRNLFTTEHAHPGQFDGEPAQPYNTTPDALLVNFKSIAFQYIPDAETRTVRIVVEPPLPQVQIVNNLVYAEGACGLWYTRIKSQVQDTGDTARVTLTGSYARSCGEQTGYYSLLGHREYVGALFTQLWRELGGTFNGRVRDGGLVAGATRQAGHRSAALAEIVRDINKISNNVMARQLLLSMGATAGAQATPDRSGRVLQQFLASRGVTMPQLVIENGSGLSRIERVSAQGLGHMLLAAFRGATMPEFIASMPLVGVDGTMYRRLTNTGVAGQAHIKTGLIAGVRALGGYVLDAKGRRVAVVLLINHPGAHNANAVQDALLRWVHGR